MCVLERTSEDRGGPVRLEWNKRWGSKGMRTEKHGWAKSCEFVENTTRTLFLFPDDMENYGQMIVEQIIVII